MSKHYVNNGNVKPTNETIEGPEAFGRFDTAIRTILSVSHDELIRREGAYKKQASLNPRKRGPKPKRKRASHDPAA